MPPPMLFLALAENPLAPDPAGNLYQYGAIGVFAVLLVFFAFSAIKRERDRTDRAEQELRELNAAMREEVIPVLTQATNAIVRVTDTMAEAAAALRDARGRR